ncbi:hypothetical protein AMTRI_Chr05g72520 [Amborella trichopoda]|uniref:Pentacotripeptide-repeat region of PRORP domain-containing protein n=1 Tax=Amborella trichopoda TaxID=13333 RepID=W1PCU5_AMBTC|nr:pentatricopeptide repeat-containing protein At2g36240 [Amborella trichopoda]ERN04865.1 hypothetical protein AMTR_s00146p00086950 [Amborella trichopoda]|eukprot:XP_006843190.1 pentatricopeptide repeat-containing protein At2g36240 [Amborella trichopoda]
MAPAPATLCQKIAPKTRHFSHSYSFISDLKTSPNNTNSSELIFPIYPTLSLSSSSLQQLHKFIKLHLKPQFKSEDLLHFLKKKLHYHIKFTYLDLHVFNWASTYEWFNHDHATYEWMAKTLAINSRFSELQTVLNSMVSNPCPCSQGIFSCPKIEPIFSFCISSYCKFGRIDDALVAFDKMKRVIDGRPSILSYNVMLNGLVKSNRHKDAIEFYSKMKREKAKPDVYTFNILISSYCRNLRTGSAVELFREMRESGCSPNVVSFNTLISGFCREGKIREGIGVAYEMLDLGFELSIATFHVLFNGLCRGGLVNDGCNLLIDLLRKRAIPKSLDCLELVEALCKEAKVWKALEIMDRLWIKGHFPTVVSCTTVLEGLRKRGDLDNGYLLMERMFKDGILPDIITYNCILQALCEIGRTLDANKIRVLASKKGLKPDADTFYILVYGFSREGNAKEGESIIDEMLDMDFIPDIATYNRLKEDLWKGERE